jgi:uncharacterized protein YlbG (UPF0298 family)
MKISEVCSFLQSKAHMDATSDELLDVYTDKNQLQKHIETLIDVKFVLKVGVNEMRFIHKEYARFWLVDTLYMVREEAEAQMSSADDDVCKKRKCSSEDDAHPTKRVKVEDAFVPSTGETQSKENSNTPSLNNEATSQQQEETEKKPPLVRKTIYIRSSPWIRVNRTLNRRVIDEWIGTILNHMTLNPSMMLSDLTKKFNILRPFDLRCMCEVLQMIGSIQLICSQFTRQQVLVSFLNLDCALCNFQCFFLLSQSPLLSSVHLSVSSSS